MKIWTIQLSRWRLAKQAGIEIVNITAKSGEQCFAPCFQAVMEYKQGVVSEATYTSMYVERMRESFRRDLQKWEALKGKRNVAYACYCRENEFCHRHIFVGLLTRYLDKEQIAYELLGEVSLDNPNYIRVKT